MGTLKTLALYGLLLGGLAYGFHACTVQQWEKAEKGAATTVKVLETGKKVVDSPAAQTAATAAGVEPIRAAGSGVLEGLLIAALALERFFSWRRKLAYDRETTEKKE